MPFEVNSAFDQPRKYPERPPDSKGVTKVGSNLQALRALCPQLVCNSAIDWRGHTGRHPLSQSNKSQGLCAVFRSKSPPVVEKCQSSSRKSTCFRWVGICKDLEVILGTM